MVPQMFEEIVALPAGTLSFVFKVESLLSYSQIHHLTNRIEIWLGKSKNSQSQNVAIHQWHSEGYLQEQSRNQKVTYQREHALSTRSSTMLY